MNPVQILLLKAWETMECHFDPMAVGMFTLTETSICLSLGKCCVSKRNKVTAKLASYFWSTEKTSFYKDGKSMYQLPVNVCSEKAAKSWFSTTYVQRCVFICDATSLNIWPGNLLPRVSLILFRRTFISINSVEEAALQVQLVK